LDREERNLFLPLPPSVEIPFSIASDGTKPLIASSNSFYSSKISYCYPSMEGNTTSIVLLLWGAMVIGNQKFDEQELKLAVGKRIRELRKAKSYSQVYVADTIGMSSKYYCEIELGRRNLSFISMVKIATVFSVSLDELISFNSIGDESSFKPELAESIGYLQRALDSLKKISEAV